MTNRELEILGTAIKALLKFNAIDEIDKIADLMMGKKLQSNAEDASAEHTCNIEE